MSDTENMPSAPMAADQRPLILIVDDLPENLAMLAAMIKEDGADVRVANAGPVAIRYAQLEPLPDLILLDIMMPGMDGYEVLSQLKANEVTKNIPVIFVTALDDEISEERGLYSGAADFITKPIKMPVLLARVHAQLELKRSRDLLSTQKVWLESEVQRRSAENAQLEVELQVALSATGLGVWEINHRSGQTRSNPSLSQLFGRESGPESIQQLLEMVHPDDHYLPVDCLKRLETEDGLLQSEFRARHQNGSWMWIEARGKVIRRDDDGKPLTTIGVMSDISARKQLESDQKLAATVFDQSLDGICITDPAATIIKINKAFSLLTGYSASEIVGQNPRALKSGVHDALFYREMWTTLIEHGNWQGEITNRRKDGSILNEWLNISAVKNTESVVTHYVAMFSDLSERKETAQRIQFLLSSDALTGLPNRNLFADRLEQSLITAKRYERGTAVILVDLDRFRVINDTLGSPIGDEILVEVSRRLSLQVREGDTVGRRNGNEFGFVMANLASEHDVIALAQRIIEAIAVPFVLNEQSLVITASLGISVAPKNGQIATELLKCADAALLRAKAAGRNTFRFYSPEMDADAARRLSLESGLRDALKNGELSIHYQPQTSLDSGQMIGMEALLRWRSPQFGSISPSEFIPIAEECGLIVSIGEWVLRTACQQTKQWLDLGMLSLRVAVNLSARQFRQPNLTALVRDALAQSGLPPAALELEITESAFIDDVDQAVAVCRELKKIGVKLSLDDFGTGYSSLAYVSRFPFDKLKIDQGFVHDIIENPVNAAIATAAIVMARSLNLTVLAEGVETEAQASFLRGRHCDAMQGYLYSKPLSVEDFSQFMGGRKTLPVAIIPAESAQTLLLLDDEPSILASLSRLLRREGYRILASTNATEAFELLAKNSVQVVISDQRMPDMTGTEFLARVRQLYPDTVRIVLTGYTDLDSVTGAINRGAIYKFLTKPWDDDQLRDQIREAFRMVKNNSPESP